MLHFSAMLLATGLLASPAAVSPEQVALEQMRQMPAYQQTIDRIYQGYESRLSTHCEAIDLDNASRHAHVTLPLQVDASGYIVRGSWTERTDGVACGEKRRYSAVVVFFDGKPKIFPLWPGDSFADPILQQDAMVQVGAAITVAGGGACPPEVLDTALPHGIPKGKGLAWEEKWTVRSCEQRYLVSVHFVLDATGTGINISPKDIVALPGK